MLSSKPATIIENIHPKRRRHRFTLAQLNKLEATFNKNDGDIVLDDESYLAQEFDVNEELIRRWFYNKRARIKRQMEPTTPSFVHVIQPSEIRDAVAQPPTAVPMVFPVKENPRDPYDGWHVKKTGAPHLSHERPSTNLRRILPKSAVSLTLSERQGQGHPKDGDWCSNVPSSNDQLRFHSGSNGMFPHYVPVSTQLPSKSLVYRTPKTLVPDKNIFAHEGLPGEITFGPKDKKHLNIPSRQDTNSVERSLNNIDPSIGHGALNEVSFFKAMCKIDTDWTPRPDDVAVMFNSYRKSPGPDFSKQT